MVTTLCQGLKVVTPKHPFSHASSKAAVILLYTIHTQLQVYGARLCLRLSAVAAPQPKMNNKHIAQAHAAKSKQDMTAYEKYEQPRMKVVVMPNKQVLGKTFKRQAKAVQEALEQMQVGLCMPSGFKHPLVPRPLPLPLPLPPLLSPPPLFSSSLFPLLPAPGRA